MVARKVKVSSTPVLTKEQLQAQKVAKKRALKKQPNTSEKSLKKEDVQIDVKNEVHLFPEHMHSKPLSQPYPNKEYSYGILAKSFYYITRVFRELSDKLNLWKNGKVR